MPGKKGDSSFADEMADAIRDKNSWKENSGDTDYWKLNRNGNIEYDGKSNLYDEDGNLIKKTNSQGKEGSLAEILFGSKVSEEQLSLMRKMMVSAGLIHTVDQTNPNNCNDWFWDKTGIIKDLALNKTVFINNVNMGKEISLSSINQLFVDTNSNPKVYDKFINSVYGSTVGFMNYTDLQNKTIAQTMLNQVYTPEQMNMLKTNQTWYNNALKDGVEVDSMFPGANKTQDFDVYSGLLELAKPDGQEQICFYLDEYHPGIDYGKSGTSVNSPGGYWEFNRSEANHRAVFTLFGTDLKMRIQHLDKESLTFNQGSVYGNDNSVILFDYPTKVNGGGTGIHTHIDLTRNLPHNGVYKRQYVNPYTLTPRSRLDYQIRKYDKNKKEIYNIRYNRNF